MSNHSFLARAAMLWIGVAALTWPAVARADSIPVGVVSFDVFIPGASGVNAININNFTGLNALPPDFSGSTDLIFKAASLTLEDTFSQTVFLGDINPGSFLFPSLQFPSTRNFRKLTFTATLSQTEFVLVDGTAFKAASPDIALTILPFAGSTLVAGTDFGVITIAPVPEPGTLPLLLSGLAGLLGLKLRRRGS
jgi:hypothetical protein